MPEYKIVKACIFECIGTFALIFFGSFIDFEKNAEESKYLILQNSMTNFFIMLSMTWITSKYSGCQLNPTISLSMFLTGDLNFTNFLFNIIGQAGGAALGQIFLSLLISKVTFYFTVEEFSFIGIIFFEMFLSFIYVLCFYLTFINKNAERNIFGFALACIYSVYILCFATFFYTRFNFVLLLIPSLITLNFNFDILWVVLGNVLGGLIAGIFYKYIFRENLEKEIESMIIQGQNELELDD